MNKTIRMVLIVALGAGCRMASNDSKAVVREPAGYTQQVLLSLGGVGTPLERAINLMEQNGFACRLQKNRPFLVETGHKWVTEYFDVVWCVPTNPIASLVRADWEPYLMVQSGKVVSIQVTYTGDRTNQASGTALPRRP